MWSSGTLYEHWAEYWDWKNFEKVRALLYKRIDLEVLKREATSSASTSVLALKFGWTKF